MARSRVFTHLTLVVSAVAAVATACGNAPTAPPLVEANRVVIADPTGRLGPLETDVRRIVEQARDRAVAALTLDGVTITVSPDAAQAIGGWGVGGFTPNGSTVNLFVDPSFPSLPAVLEARLSPLVAHELHHAKRFRGPGYGETLLEACVSEGLADRFAIELLGAEVPPWSRALTAEDLATWLAKASTAFDRTDYGHSTWFFGASPTTPRWTGYTVGYHLVAEYQRRHPASAALSLVHTSASAFRP